ncbi:leucine-rich repeat-containing protein 63 isoform X1 [Canis lupus baileyi]|uniref:Leucine rich repeat containing 63 n=1 Tax=Canis lupus familiaris TaxID=9615 RepID=A0A8C0SQ99_CANLF|nr:leucine-rich repeat-containing protein 63 isoform X1 [Canis lupus familiaris]XP_038425474.1 leucine-rich repeat-containing protein 63 isoform X1 [Canis lupus familiaris]XP_038425475.1 leucine-rich repeat-containing protein 63 isoform X1 [Canis lupus familiaris]XP_038425476.1 leucine-rich repeat-containing protein 63 isoform X1 [Canis lupus familiaris]XP_038425477.1 leucine-rich repeat-containing protein 63 isoform X1 [Canis lupus familiaris]|eukprot:XP_005633944.1 leucine-rich repeat-containing protein 63 isoform X1 [Canis lupus familiaris]
MQNHPQLLRRPLPPKLPKLPLSKKKVPTAKTGKTEPKHVKFTHDETTLIQRRKTSFPDVVSGDQSQALVNIQNLFLDHYIQERVTTISISRKSKKSASWHIPETATGSIFFPSSHSASSRIFRKETSQMKISRKSKEAASKITNIYFGDMFKDILILSGPSSTTSQAITPKHKKVGSEYLISSKDKTYTFKQQLVGPRATVPSPVPRLMHVKTERWWSPQFKEKTAVILSITHFPGLISIPSPVLPRKPHRQSLLETQVTESENLESAPRQITPSLSEGIIKSKNQEDSQAHVIHGGGLKTINVTRYETIITMTNFAIVNCQIYGRNALKLKGFFLMNCPDLTPLASQLIYLNLSFNDISHFPTEVFCLKNLQILLLRNNPIKEIPSEIQQLKFLRIFSIAFNLITTLPPGLFSLSHLEELDISYNSIDSIPNEIQKLRSLEKLNVDGNDLTSFPPAILKLNLKKIQFENTYTHPILWKENSLNSPQHLTQLTSFFFLKNNLHKHYDTIPVEIQKLLKCTSRCEWCNGPKFGEGFQVIRSYDVSGATHLPVLFHVCSSSCYRKVKESSFFSENIPSGIIV